MVAMQNQLSVIKLFFHGSLKQVLDEVKHIGKIADFMSEWEGRIADELELTYAERTEILEANRGKLGNQK